MRGGGVWVRARVCIHFIYYITSLQYHLPYFPLVWKALEPQTWLEAIGRELEGILKVRDVLCGLACVYSCYTHPCCFSFCDESISRPSLHVARCAAVYVYARAVLACCARAHWHVVRVLTKFGGDWKSPSAPPLSFSIDYSWGCKSAWSA